MSRRLLLIGLAILLVLVNGGAAAGSSSVFPSEGLLVFSCDCTEGGETPLFTLTPDGSDLRVIPGTEASSAPRWSPSRRTIAFARTLDHAQSIWLVRDDGSGARRLTRPAGNTNDWSPAWSPRGDRLVFVRSRPRSVSLRSIDTAGRRWRTLVSGPSAFRDADWAPDGRRIAGSRARNEANNEFWVVNADGSSLRRLGPRGLVGAQPRWSPEGARLAYVDVDDTSVRVLRLGSGRARTVFDPDEVIYDREYNGWGLAWSPDGRWLAVLRTAAVECVDDPTTDSCEQAQIWIVSVTGGRQKQIYASPRYSFGYGLDWR
jgi:Tol biopolymer transport system component